MSPRHVGRWYETMGGGYGLQIQVREPVPAPDIRGGIDDGWIVLGFVQPEGKRRPPWQWGVSINRHEDTRVESTWRNLDEAKAELMRRCGVTEIIADTWTCPDCQAKYAGVTSCIECERKHGTCRICGRANPGYIYATCDDCSSRAK